MLLRTLCSPKGQALMEYTVLAGLISMSLVAAIATVSDQLLDIWNDLAEDLDVIDDTVADLDVVMPESNEDWDPSEDAGGGGVPPI